MSLDPERPVDLTIGLIHSRLEFPVDQPVTFAQRAQRRGIIVHRIADKMEGGNQLGRAVNGQLDCNAVDMSRTGPESIIQPVFVRFLRRESVAAWPIL